LDQGEKVPGYENPKERKLQETKIPENGSYREREFQGTNVPGSESSTITKVPVTGNSHTAAK